MGKASLFFNMPKYNLCLFKLFVLGYQFIKFLSFFAGKEGV